MNLPKRPTAAAIVIILLASAWSSRPAAADVKLPAIFSDNMVLQRDITVPIWGWGEPGEKVTVTLAGTKATAVADADGKWLVKLPAMKAGGPVEMTVSGNSTVTVKNVLIGEVWLCSGQSNMAWPVSEAANAKQEIAAANYPNIRFFSVVRTAAASPQEDCKGIWTDCRPETAKNFSAVGYFFGRDLHAHLKVPVGLIHSSWGATPVEAWTRRQVLEAQPQAKELLERWDKRIKAYEPQAAKKRFQAAMEKYNAAIKNWKAAEARAKQAAAKAARGDEAAKAAARKAATQAKKAKAAVPRKPSRWAMLQDPRKSPRCPAALYNGMIAPLIPFGIRGVIWYQGESNTGRSYQYRSLFPDMINNWRQDWGRAFGDPKWGQFTFLWVQLANYRKRLAAPAPSSWAELREAQSMALRLPKTGQAVAIDIGNATNIHPKNKQAVANRLVLAARKIAYGQDVCFSGPVYESMKIEGNKIILRFKHTCGGLVAKGPSNLKGFAIAGPDRKFVWANARIEGPTVIVWADKVAKPVAVRYAWADNPECNLYNKAGLPASPFRTDNWPGMTAGNR